MATSDLYMADLFPRAANHPAVPVHLQLGSLRVLVVGGTQIPTAALRHLLDRSPEAEITLLAPFFTGPIRDLVHHYPNLQLVQKAYDTTDLIDVQLVIAATNYADLIEKLTIDCQEKAIPFSLAAWEKTEIIQPKHTADNNQKTTIDVVVEGSERNWRKIATYFVIAFALMVGGHILLGYIPFPSVEDSATYIRDLLSGSFGLFMLIGFFAQLVDGALGMGYGLVSSTCLMTAGVNPVSISAAVHTAEVFTSGISGYSHYRFGNVNRKLFRHLVLPGVIGAICGALLLVLLGEHAGKWLLPVIAIYALLLGVRILFRAFQLKARPRKVKRIGWLAGIGGFLDSFGGGGWGPIVTSTLLAGGRSPRYTIGSVSLTEFFVTLSSAATFFIAAGTGHWPVIVGLLLGGGIAAPLAAKLAGKLPARTLMIAVGLMAIVWSLRLIIRSFF